MTDPEDTPIAIYCYMCPEHGQNVNHELPSGYEPPRLRCPEEGCGRWMVTRKAGE